MQLSQKSAQLFIPDSLEEKDALPRTTHLGIGAHQDDLEFMALHGILECFQDREHWFGGITCTDGAGSARSGKYADYTDEQMKAIRVNEQNTAATIGQYSFMVQIGHPSAHAKEADKRPAMSRDIRAILEATQPDIVYTHNPFDKHATHIGVLLATLEAIQSLPAHKRPKQLIGCEVWRGLDWLSDSMKLIHDVSAHPNLTAALNGVFDSQITGGKRYDLAVVGRRLANATFFDSHSVDSSNSVAYAIDLSELIDDISKLERIMHDGLKRLNREVFQQLESLTESFES